ncbi:protein TorT [Sagittula marina]|uniref:Protein TorT n=1 Tax=Sagittula marina TaxID=943940 RepID=A0A7W6GVV8_9RHOB|nr:TMAO reductase system periplasmic protein TorT [Sagittula marina]MBB3987784.1 protein TorT [Sagittula marina]
MADRIWIKRMSNLVWRIARLYGCVGTGTIATLCLGACLSLVLTLAPIPLLAGPSRLICVLVPHFKDEYWLSVAYGLEQEAARQNADLLMYEAGGYGAKARQIEQLAACADRGVDAILIGAVTQDDPALRDAIAASAHDVPIFGLVNDVESDALQDRIGVDWHDMGLIIGRHLATLHPEGSEKQSALLVSGPPRSGWPALLEAGLRDGLATSAVTIIDGFGADTGLRQQLSIVETALMLHPDADYLIGSAPAIEAAMGLRARPGDRTSPTLISTYISHTVLRGLKNGAVMAASFDDPALQGELAIRRIVEGAEANPGPGPLGPQVVLLSRSPQDFTQIRLSPADYFPDIQ